VETRSSLDGFWQFHESDASLCDEGVQFYDCFDVLVDDGLIDERPERFRRP
jgi:hypothetical protein